MTGGGEGGLRILMVAPQVPPAVGGVETHVSNLSRQLRERGHEVTLVGALPRRARQSAGGMQPDEDGTGPFSEVVSTSPWRFVPVVSRLARSGRFDLAHLHSYHQPYAALADAALPPGLPRVFTGHYHGDGHSAAARLAHPAYRALAGAKLVRRAGRVVCVSAAEAELVRKDFPGCRPVVVPNGLELPRAAEPYPEHPGSRLVLAVGRLERYKGMDRLIAAASMLDGGRAVLVIVGDGPDRSRLERLAREAPAGRVVVMGSVSDEVLASLWARADVFATASCKEAFGLTVATAVALGVPVVASDIPAHVEVLSGRDRPGVRVVSLDAPAGVWAAALQDASAGPRPSGTFLSWADVATDVERLYREVVSDVSV